jgi:VanZ family protein
VIGWYTFRLADSYFWYTFRLVSAGALLGVSLPAFIASIDEYSQEFVGRGSALNDVIIDISGAVFANIIILIVYIFYNIGKKIYLRHK